jgi:hypothetical protein
LKPRKGLDQGQIRGFGDRFNESRIRPINRMKNDASEDLNGLQAALPLALQQSCGFQSKAEAGCVLEDEFSQSGVNHEG